MLGKIWNYFFGSPSPEDIEKAGEVAEALIKNKIAVFSKSYCPYCKRAKALLDQLGAEYAVIELNDRSDGAAIQAYLLNRTGQRTVPNIFINQSHVGGCDDLMAAHANGSLAKMLAA